jgi:hypothetical protein
VLVDFVLVVIWRKGSRVCEAVCSWEEQRTLSFPILGIDKTRCNARSVLRGTTAVASVELFQDYCSNNVLLPVAKRLVAEHPVPLQIGCVSDSSICVNFVVDVVTVHACSSVNLSISIRLAICDTIISFVL